METVTRVASADVVAAYMRACGEMTCDPVTLVGVLGRADVDRRSFLRTSVYSAALSAALASQSDIARLAAVDDAARVGMPEVRAVQGITDAFLRLDEVKGGGIGRTAVAEFLSTDVASLLRSRFTDSKVRSAAFSAAAELAYLAGFKAHDAGADGIAQRYYLSALRLAEESGVPGQDGFYFRILGLHATDVRQPQHAAELAERGVAAARDKVCPDTMSLFLVRSGALLCRNGAASSGAEHPPECGTMDRHGSHHRATSLGGALVPEQSERSQARHRKRSPPWVTTLRPSGTCTCRIRCGTSRITPGFMRFPLRKQG
ncbi:MULTISPECIES: hypothetical protein [Nocardia]|uniref:hypothetical protein n=1 Tax=Nocardia TaxID=1817 RepID=UPI00135ADC3D|nr:MULTISPECIES: hypothetical protein [Nocardia]